jgi:hypothetical protein
MWHDGLGVFASAMLFAPVSYCCFVAFRPQRELQCSQLFFTLWIGYCHGSVSLVLVCFWVQSYVALVVESPGCVLLVFVPREATLQIWTLGLVQACTLYLRLHPDHPQQARSDVPLIRTLESPISASRDTCIEGPLALRRLL